MSLACPIECRRVERASHRTMYVLAVVAVCLALYFGA